MASKPLEFLFHDASSELQSTLSARGTAWRSMHVSVWRPLEGGQLHKFKYGQADGKPDFPHLSLLLNKNTLNPRQQTERFLRFFNLLWIFPLSTVQNIPQDIPSQIASDKFAPGRIPTN